MALPSPRDVILPEGYYHTHFLALVRTVHQRYADLLCAEENAFAQDFLALPEAAQKLFVRLSNRVGPWFVVGKLCYAEIGDCAAAARTLEAADFVEGGKACTSHEALALLTVADLKAAFASLLKTRGALGREALVAAITEGLGDEEILRLSLARVDEVVRPRHADTVRLLQFLYFGNTGQGMTDFVLADMGLMRYEAYALDASTRAFACREAALDALAARDAHEALYLALEQERESWNLEVLVAARDAALARLGSFHPRAHRRLFASLNLLGNRLERAGAAGEALACYVASAAPPARERTVRLLEKQGEREKAVTLATDTLTSSLDEGELAFAYRYLVRTAKVPHERLPLAPDEAESMRYFLSTKNTVDLWPQRKLVLPAQQRSLGVEEAALRALAEEGTAGGGAHCENLLWCALFGLVFWQEIFAPVPGAFHHPYQLGPSDGASPRFALARQEACEATLAAFAAGDLDLDTLAARWRAKEGIANRWIAWPAVPWEQMEKLLTACPHAALARVLARMLRHPGRFDSGFPDLFVWSEGHGAFWEVKGPGDELRPHQKSWLAFLGSAGLNVGVCVVSFV